MHVYSKQNKQLNECTLEYTSETDESDNEVYGARSALFSGESESDVNTEGDSVDEDNADNESQTSKQPDELYKHALAG